MAHPPSETRVFGPPSPSLDHLHEPPGRRNPAPRWHPRRRERPGGHHGHSSWPPTAHELTLGIAMIDSHRKHREPAADGPSIPAVQLL